MDNPEPMSYQHFLVGLGILSSNYPPRAQNENSADALAIAWWITLKSEIHWLTNDIYDQAIKITLRAVKDYLPPVGAFLDTCREEKRQLERTRALPVPAPVPATHETYKRFQEMAQKITGRIPDASRVIHRQGQP